MTQVMIAAAARQLVAGSKWITKEALAPGNTWKGLSAWISGHGCFIVMLMPCHAIETPIDLHGRQQTFDSRMEQIRGEYFKEIRMMQAWSLFCFIETARERIWRMQIQIVSVPKCYTECHIFMLLCSRRPPYRDQRFARLCFSQG